MPILLLLSANFIFYITFVQFGLLRMINGRFGLSIESLGLPLGLMALTGAFTSVSIGYLIDKYSISQKRVFYTACIISILEGTVAVFSIDFLSRGLLLPVFIVLGLLMGTNGILVIRAVESWPVVKRGIMAGTAMALVYLLANILAGSISTPERVALINGILVAVIGALCLSFKIELRPYPNPISTIESGSMPFGYFKAIAILATLVAVDSFVFHLETNKKELYAYTWEGRWLWNGAVHAVSAIAAGLVLNRRGEQPVFTIALSVFALALILLILFPMGYFTGFISTLFYNTAVSFYGILILIIWFCWDFKVGVGLRIGAGMAFIGWVASPLGIAAAIELIPAPIQFLLIGPLIVIIFLILITNQKPKLNTYVKARGL